MASNRNSSPCSSGRCVRSLLSPAEEKRKILRTADNPWGFYDQELTRHTPDWKQIYDVGPPEGGVIVPQWPTVAARIQARHRAVLRGVQRAWPCAFSAR